MSASRDRLKILRAADYVVPPCCALCTHGERMDCDDSWTGTCALHGLTVSIFGYCKYFARDDEMTGIVLGEDRALVERREHARSDRHKAKPRY